MPEGRIRSRDVDVGKDENVDHCVEQQRWQIFVEYELILN